MKNEIKNTTRADRILLVSLIIVSVFGIFAVQEAMPRGSDVIIEIDGKPAYVFPLYEDRTIPLHTSGGNMLVEIKEKKVRVTESDCPKKICVLQGWVSSGAIVCLPFKVVIIVGSGSSGLRKGIDAITG